MIARVPRAALVCAAIAVANAVCWAAITPTFWVPDEPPHVGYVQRLAEAGTLPSRGSDVADIDRPGLAEEQSIVYGELRFGVEGRPSWSRASDARLERALNTEGLERTTPGQALYALNHPPLYYLLEVVPYRALHGESFLDRLFAMRLFSALFAGVTVFFAFLFLRELLPRTKWVWTVGALALAFHPVLGFMAGGVNNDVLAYAAAAALFYGIARAFRRGLTPGTGAFIGAAAAAGLLAKLTVAGLFPGVVVGLAALVWRAAPEARRRASVAAGVAVAVPTVAWAAWVLVSKLVVGDVPAATGGVATSSLGGDAAALRDQASYLWQAFLPRLPFMQEQFPWYPPWETYFKGFIGRFGWFEYGFAQGWYLVALAIFVAVVGLAGAALVRARGVLVAHRGELATYAAMTGGLLLSLELLSYRYHQAIGGGAYFEQARYLFPLLALYAGLIALAARGAGRRWGPAVGAFLVVLAIGHSLFAQLLTVARFYS